MSGEERRAIEALRAGVPNRAAIRFMGSTETEITNAFLTSLARSRSGAPAADAVRGQVVAGGFGSGKSHLLGYLQELALQEGFVVSWVAISKETPLFDVEKVFLAAMRNAIVPQRNDDIMTAVLGRLRRNDAYDELEGWASDPASDLSPMFAALLHLIPSQQGTPERLQQIGRFFAGGKLGVAPLKQWLREAGAQRMFPIKPVKAAELARQRLRFAPRLMRAAGFGGWCVLLDEVELVGRYSVVQRGRSYAELARWLGLDTKAAASGIAAVAAVTDDFRNKVIGDRRDEELAPAKLLAKGERETADLAAIGIRELQDTARFRILRAPDPDMLGASLEKVRQLYERAYGWSPPATAVGERFASKSMRQYIKSWVTIWDIQRLYGTTSEIETGTVDSDYSESRDMEQTAAPEDDGEHDE